ncbi:MAG: class I mannose-6-phosphate isomerase, partial [Bacteroidales bacterium]|nr:class I mannose-6-phosphate isomerase [Bacteroidales bacterium]
MCGMYPMKFEPLLTPFVWGGQKIAPYKGIISQDTNIGESWELSGVEGLVSVVANGPLAGKTITELVKMYKGQLVGEHVYANTGDEFPLLFKFIDAHRDLSIQVHPNDALAAQLHPGSRGKTEMWYVIAAEPGAKLYSGLTKTITPEQLATMAADGTITDVLACHD